MYARVLRFSGPTLVGASHALLSGSNLSGPRRGLRAESRSASAKASSIDSSGLQEAAAKLRSTYTPAFAFPEWVINDYLGKSFSQFEEDARQCAIFYEKGDGPSAPLMLATQREPVNIGMKRLYDQSRFHQLFGWRTGAYGEIYASGTFTVPPNVAVMCQTPVVAGMRGPNEQVSKDQLQAIQTGERLHILSVIAYAFDSPRQPDMEYFLGAGGEITDARRRELIEHFGKIFDKVFAAALHCKLEVVVLSKFGAGAFSELYPGNLFQDVWMPAFTEAVAAWKTRLHAGSVTEISLMGGEHEPGLISVAEAAGFSSSVYKYFPDPLRSQLGRKLSKALLVNAWDSWSFIGNGNFADASLDGYVGRATALAVLGWPVTNPFLRDNMIPVSRPE